VPPTAIEKVAVCPTEAVWLAGLAEIVGALAPVLDAVDFTEGFDAAVDPTQPVKVVAQTRTKHKKKKRLAVR
jgi:hypothetical protein